jgi:formylglycine-generating enzyme required for sulfatase activity
MKNMRNFLIYISFCLFMASCGNRTTTQSPQETLTNSIDVEFVLIPAGTFTIGTTSEIDEFYDFEIPRHEVTISKPFYIGRYEVTQEQWEKVMGNNPSSFKNPKNPVEMVTFEDVQLFIQKLNEMEKTTKYRLPTEAEWEYAARAGSNTKYFFGDDDNELENYAWYEKNSEGKPHPVGGKKPNAWGLYDMLGNINEYVQDWFSEDYYSKSPTVDPKGPESGTRLKRGGSWFAPIKYNHSAMRDGVGPIKSDKRGFRLVLTIE